MVFVSDYIPITYFVNLTNLKTQTHLIVYILQWYINIKGFTLFTIREKKNCLRETNVHASALLKFDYLLIRIRKVGSTIS